MHGRRGAASEQVGEFPPVQLLHQQSKDPIARYICRVQPESWSLSPVSCQEAPMSCDIGLLNSIQGPLLSVNRP